MEKSEIGELVKRAQEGDNQAFTVLYNEYVKPLYRFIFFKVYSREDADDLTQTVFTKAFRSLSSYSDQGLSFSSWLYTIARHSLIDFYKKKRPLVARSDDDEQLLLEWPDDNPDPEAQAIEGELQERLHEVLNDLPELQREILSMRYFQELSNREISILVGKSEEAIRQIQSRAIKILRDKML